MSCLRTFRETRSKFVFITQQRRKKKNYRQLAYQYTQAHVECLCVYECVVLNFIYICDCVNQVSKSCGQLTRRINGENIGIVQMMMPHSVLRLFN